ncbi:MAG TPA: VOC family protein [Chitinophagaceae bacterium]
MQLITYVTFAGNCEEALNFYKEVLGGEVLQISKMGEGPMEVPEHVKGKIMHARLKIGENVLYMSDTFDPASIIQGNNVSLSLQPETIAQTEDLFNKLSAGGTVKMPLEDTFWGARFGMFTDKFGIHWMINCELKKEAALN